MKYYGDHMSISLNFGFADLLRILQRHLVLLFTTLYSAQWKAVKRIPMLSCEM